MANTSYEQWWKIFLMCKECWEFKEINSINRYKHKDWYLWVLWRCKSCILKWRSTERELKLARIRDHDRYHNNIKRRLYATWCWMNNRCYNKNNSHYKWYWWKWVKVEWRNFDDFYDDVHEMYEEYWKLHWFNRKDCQFDRIDNNWNYCKENIRLVNAKFNNEFNKQRQKT